MNLINHRVSVSSSQTRNILKHCHMHPSDVKCSTAAATDFVYNAQFKKQHYICDDTLTQRVCWNTRVATLFSIASDQTYSAGCHAEDGVLRVAFF